MPKTCFFISRIGDPGSPERDFSDKLLRYIIEPILLTCGYEKPLRADHITQPGVITTQVFSHLWEDDLVIADLTGSNPNVFYELAVRHMRRKPFVHMIQKGQRIPFDVAPNRTIEFDFEIDKAELAKERLKAMVEDCGTPAATVETPLSAAIDFSSEPSNKDPVFNGVSQILSIVQEIKGALVSATKSPDRNIFQLSKTDDGRFRLKPHGGSSTSVTLSEPNLRRLLGILGIPDEFREATIADINASAMPLIQLSAEQIEALVSGT